ncbi:MAG: DsbA family protein [Chloroflexi bacterium]|nr:DsbA family protein [Chloroflexota bacterium]
MKALKETHDLTLRWRSFELRPAGAPPIPDDYRQYIETVGRPRFNQIMREQHGIEVHSGPFGISSRDALVGEKIADAYGFGEAFHDLVTRAYWDEAKDISDPTVLRTLAEASGMDGERFLTLLDDPQYDALVSEDVALARQLGLSGVPALVFAGRYLVAGAQPVDVLRQVVERVQAETEGPAS